MSPLHTALDEFEVWFVTGSVSLYGEDSLREVARQSQEIVEQLNQSSDIPVRIVWKPVAADTEQIRNILADADRDERVIGVIAWMHTFSPAKMWVRGLQGLKKPLLHFATQANVALPWRTVDFDFLNLNQSAHGDREFAYGATRSGRPRATVVGHASTPGAAAQIGRWQRAAAGRAAIDGLRVARFGDNMRHVAVTEGDKTEAEKIFGVQVNTWPVTELADAVDGASAEAVDALLSEYDDVYDVAPDLRPDGSRRESLRYAAAIEAGLRAFLEEGGFGAFTTTFEDLGSLRQLPGLAPQRLQSDGYGFGPEGDWKSAVLIRAAAVMGLGLGGGASIMEDYTYDLTPGRELILGSHMLEVSPSIYSGRPRLEIHPLGIGGREDPPRLVFTADAGAAVVASLTDVGDRFRMVANTVDIVGPSEELERLPVATAVWSPKPDFETSVSCWLTAGASHHTMMTTAIDAETLRLFTEMCGIEFAAIDESTTVGGFRRDLVANAAAHQLGVTL